MADLVSVVWGWGLLGRFGAHMPYPQYPDDADYLEGTFHPFLCVKLVCGFPLVNVDAPTVSTVFDVLFILFLVVQDAKTHKKTLITLIA